MIEESEKHFKCRGCGSKSSDYEVSDDGMTVIHDIECTECGGDYNYEYCNSCCPCSSQPCECDTGGECPYWNWEEDYCEWRKEKVECSYCGASSLIERQHEKNEKNTEWDWPLIMFGGIGLFMLLWLLGVI